jgi:hypothetical protein
MQTHPLRTQLVNAVRTLLRPVVRQLIAYGVSYPALDRLLRQLYLEVAEKDFALPFKRQTDSRLALVTGLNRKEIAALRGRRASRSLTRGLEADVLTHAVGRWLGGPPYAAKDGSPRQLPYEADTANAPSFARLIRELNVDIPVRAVLDELIRNGTVELLPSGDVVLRRQGRIVADDIEAKIGLLGSEPAELFATIVHNIEDAQAPWLQRKVVYDNVGSEALAALEAEARQLGEELIRRANVLLASYDRDRNANAPGGTRMRVVLGAYFLATQPDVDEAPLAPTEKEPPRPPNPPGRIRRSR